MSKDSSKFHNIKLTEGAFSKVDSFKSIVAPGKVRPTLNNNIDTVDKLIKPLSILTSTEVIAIKTTKEIIEYNSDFSKELAQAMSQEVIEGRGEQLDFSRSDTLKIKTGKNTKEFSVITSPSSKLKKINIDPSQYSEDDNFTMSLAFQDINGKNMPLDGALYLQIRVVEGKIVSINQPPLEMDEEGQYYALDKNNKKVYPKAENIEELIELQREIALANDTFVTNESPSVKIKKIAENLKDDSKNIRDTISNVNPSLDDSTRTSHVIADNEIKAVNSPVEVKKPASDGAILAGHDQKQISNSKNKERGTPQVEKAALIQRELTIASNNKNTDSVFRFLPAPPQTPNVKKGKQEHTR